MKRVTGDSSISATTLNGDTSISDTTLNGDTLISVTTLTADFDSQFEAPAASGWVLTTGIWNDSEYWDDSAIWND